MIDKDLNVTVERLKRKLKPDQNFDILFREIEICSKQAALFFINGFYKDEQLTYILSTFKLIKDKSAVKDAESFSKAGIAFGEVSLIDEEEEIITCILSGQIVLFIDGFDKAILIDARAYPQRSSSEPDKDKVFRGSRDGFVETVVLNTALIRRRIRNTNLVMKHMYVGKDSKTDIVISYMKDRVDKKLLRKITQRLENIEVSALNMNQESMAEILVKRRWYNPLPKFKFTERPDTTAAHILEGDIAILVDNSPSAILLPSTIFSIMEEANDYYFPPFIGTYLKLTRGFIILLTIVITPTWLLLLYNPGWVPDWLNFILITDDIKVPIIFQLLILEVAIDGMNLAALNTPNLMMTSLSIVAAIIVGDYAVSSGWFSPQALLYTAFVALANFTQPGYELGYAFKFMRIFILILTGIFNIWGYIAGIVLCFLLLVFTKTATGKGFLYPFIPFSWKNLKHHLYRKSLLEKDKLDK